MPWGRSGIRPCSSHTTAAGMSVWFLFAFFFAVGPSVGSRSSVPFSSVESRAQRLCGTNAAELISSLRACKTLASQHPSPPVSLQTKCWHLLLRCLHFAMILGIPPRAFSMLLDEVPLSLCLFRMQQQQQPGHIAVRGNTEVEAETVRCDPSGWSGLSEAQAEGFGGGGAAFLSLVVGDKTSQSYRQAVVSTHCELKSSLKVCWPLLLPHPFHWLSACRNAWKCWHLSPATCLHFGHPSQ